MNICIFGASSDTLAAEYYSEAEKLGKLLGKDGHTVVFGGGCTGLMGACANGVRSTNGQLIGIAPGFFNDPGVLVTDYGKLLITEGMRERKQLMDDSSEAIIALPGGLGTFDELFEALTLKQIGKSHKPIILLNTRGYYNNLINLLHFTAAEGFMSSDSCNLFALCESPESALAELCNISMTHSASR